MSPSVVAAFGLAADQVKLEPFGNGLINYTWKASAQGKEYILQKVNDKVFRRPADIAHNCRIIADYLRQHHPAYLFVGPIPASNGEALYHQPGDGWYRLFPFVGGSHSIDVVRTPEQAFEASRQFGRFTRLLSGLDVTQLKNTIPFFHDLELRYRQFQQALTGGNSRRIAFTREVINTLESHAAIVAEYKNLKANPAFRIRVAHHDTKISNVLFDNADKGLCVIDLDTVMPGHFISDVGDMMRTYLSPVSEEEQDLSKIGVREAFYHAVVEGYYAEMQDELTAVEKQHFLFAGKFMIYMQALRFLTDYLNDDVYYGAAYEGHNLLRAKNQLTLLERLVEKEPVLAASTVGGAHTDLTA